mmetsp:Transcript_50193/g.104736  ORF Transcript_50193/g.104736 Transcript_50193/m.104736 type:complete len:207 (+) Transcript_50193:3489-4109(+)
MSAIQIAKLSATTASEDSREITHLIIKLGIPLSSHRILAITFKSRTPASSAARGTSFTTLSRISSPARNSFGGRSPGDVIAFSNKSTRLSMKMLLNGAAANAGSCAGVCFDAESHKIFDVVEFDMICLTQVSNLSVTDSSDGLSLETPALHCRNSLANTFTPLQISSSNLFCRDISSTISCLRTSSRGRVPLSFAFFELNIWLKDS